MARRKGMMKGKGRGYKNVIGKDPMVHSQSAKGIKQPQKVKINMAFKKIPYKQAEERVRKGEFLQPFFTSEKYKQSLRRVLYTDLRRYFNEEATLSMVNEYNDGNQIYEFGKKGDKVTLKLSSTLYPKTIKAIEDSGYKLADKFHVESQIYSIGFYRYVFKIKK